MCFGGVGAHFAEINLYQIRPLEEHSVAPRNLIDRAAAISGHFELR